MYLYYLLLIVPWKKIWKNLQTGSVDLIHLSNRPLHSSRAVRSSSSLGGVNRLEQACLNLFNRYYLCMEMKVVSSFVLIFCRFCLRLLRIAWRNESCGDERLVPIVADARSNTQRNNLWLEWTRWIWRNYRGGDEGKTVGAAEVLGLGGFKFGDKLLVLLLVEGLIQIQQYATAGFLWL